MSEIRFDGPPPLAKAGSSASSRHAEIVDALKARPCEWAVVEVTDRQPVAHSLAAAIRSARLKAYQPAGSFEAVSRKFDGEHRVYARFVGEGGAA